ncbi:MAG: anthranilate synthase component I [Planctomycetaceae bacterium]|nr:anthranilate synthase component I [Planctomycetaceae bacterium]
MAHLPDFNGFCELAEGSGLVPVYRRLVSDTLTPVSAYCRIAAGDCAFLFESVVGGERVGRYSFVGSDPFLRIEAHGCRVMVTGCGNDPTGRDEVPGEGEIREVTDPLNELESLLGRYRAAPVPGLPRFCGGAVGYAGYDVIRYSEHLPNPPEDDRQLPDMVFAFYDRMVVFDHINKTVLVVAHARSDADDPEAEYRRACARVDETCGLLASTGDELQLADFDSARAGDRETVSNFSQESFQQAVTACQKYIRAGDIFQVVLSQRLSLETRARPLDIYRALRVVNPSPFMFLLKLPGVDLVGSSPEIMVRVEDGEVTVRPLAGTCRRGRTDEEDHALAEKLLADPKERAEHVMLVDLARNDVGRVAGYGSVELSDVMTVERYSHVMHISTNVRGRLAEGHSALDALRAGLPVGTVSGAPKVRAMEIIDEQEPHRRGPYAGAVGYIDFTGNMDTCIALRTLVMKGHDAYVQAGAGIVADSVPETEFHETLNKARGLLAAIDLAETQLMPSVDTAN